MRGRGVSSRGTQRLPSEKRVQQFQDILENIARIERFTAGLDTDGLARNEQFGGSSTPNLAASNRRWSRRLPEWSLAGDRECLLRRSLRPEAL